MDWQTPVSSLSLSHVCLSCQHLPTPTLSHTHSMPRHCYSPAYLAGCNTHKTPFSFFLTAVRQGQVVKGRGKGTCNPASPASLWQSPDKTSDSTLRLLKIRLRIVRLHNFRPRSMSKVFRLDFCSSYWRHRVASLERSCQLDSNTDSMNLFHETTSQESSLGDILQIIMIYS